MIGMMLKIGFYLKEKSMGGQILVLNFLIGRKNFLTNVPINKLKQIFLKRGVNDDKISF